MDNSNIINAGELLDMQLDEPQWLIEGILPAGVCILAGKPKVRKSWLAVQIAVAVSNGEKVLGDYVASKGSCLYVSLEDNRRRLKSRLEKLQVNRDQLPLLDIATEWPRSPEGMGAIRRWIESKPNAKLIIVDTLEGIRPTRQNANVYAEDYEALNPFRNVFAEYGVSFVLVHHQRKKASNDWLDTVLGSTGLTGAADTIWVMENRMQPRSAVLRIAGRDVAEGEHVVLFDAETMRCTSLGAADSYPHSSSHQDIYIALKRHKEPLGPTELAQIIGKEAGTIRKSLYDMMRNGTVKQIAYGKYVAGDSVQNLN